MQQLPRIVIAAVFFVIAALIAYPMINRSNTKSQASSAPSSTSPSASASATATKSGGAPSPRRTPTKTPTPTPTRTTPTPTRSATATPAVPLTATIGSVKCPSRSVTVQVKNVGSTRQNYTIEQDGTPTVADQLGAGVTRTSKLTLKEDDNTKVAVVWNDRTLKSTTRKANCTHPAPQNPPQNLPHTGPSTAVTFARVATAIGALITGAIVLWYGGLWPRRREQVLRAKR